MNLLLREKKDLRHILAHSKEMDVCDESFKE